MISGHLTMNHGLWQSRGRLGHNLVSSRRTGQMPTPPVTHYRWNDMPKETVNAGLDRRLITGTHMMLAHVYLKKGCVVPRHQHGNEQLTYVLEGALHFWIGE